ncbi:MAG TPA: GNAT family N-acetyltransferase [Rhodobacteraceae bacterium]|jgi:GNAT superfamily N-acetyltransferase|nr:GNAT family N-acetyltransferase [Paracoccaceae bacterium]HBH00096.1 GNAT family N-acetyltransferase [Paracoccaceae bacterium]
MTTTIRPLAAADEPAWRDLWRAYLAFYETEVAGSVHDIAFARLLSDDPHEFHGLIAEVDGKPVGLAHYLFHRHGWQVEPVCYLQDLFAAPAMRGRGVGRALIEAVYRAADAAGAPSVYWLTQDFNAPARQLYDRVGRLTPFVKYTRPAG